MIYNRVKNFPAVCVLNGRIAMKLSGKNLGKSPEKITNYIPVATPSIWLSIATLLVFLGVLLIWGNVGRVPLKLTTTGVGYNYDHRTEKDELTEAMIESGDYDVDTFLCLVNPNQITGEIIHDKPVNVILRDGRRIRGRTELVYTVPLNAKEVMKTLEELNFTTDWEQKSLDLGDYRYIVDVTIDEKLPVMSYGEPAEIVIEYDTVPPIHYLFR